MLPPPGPADWQLLVPGALLTLGIALLARQQLHRIGFRSRETYRDSRGHVWTRCKAVSAMCNLCEQVSLQVASQFRACELCGLHAHERCASRGRAPCKAQPAPGASPTQRAHCWVRGNLPFGASCAACGGLCNGLGVMLDAAAGFRCALCQAAVHDGCRADFGDTCSLGRHAKLALGPWQVLQDPQQAEAAAAEDASAMGSPLRLRRRKQQQPPPPPSPATPRGLDGVRINPDPRDTPLVVFVNGKSGGNQGRALLSAFRRRLHAVQVVDLQDGGPEAALRAFAGVPRARVLACGGDGTVGWILGVLDALALEHPPPVGVLPLGTGNDLARELGWGPGYADESVDDVLRDVAEAQVALLDRWAVAGAARPVVMNNYLGVGVDAQVALEFHEMRQSNPRLFFHRAVNKLWYSHVGAKEFVARSNADLARHVELVCDGERVPLPDGCEGIIVLNIGSYGGGARPWKGAPAGFDDGRLEVVAVLGSLHLGRIQVGIDDAVPLAQCRELSVTTTVELPVQVDGEPWRQPPAQLGVRHQSQAIMLRRAESEADSRVTELLDWGLAEGVLTEAQHRALEREAAARRRGS